jgi:hypothetical protein
VEGELVLEQMADSMHFSPSKNNPNYFGAVFYGSQIGGDFFQKFCKKYNKKYVKIVKNEIKIGQKMIKNSKKW